MWNYSEKMMDHFRNPRNVGTIDKPDGTATVGSLACGDALTFQFKLGPDGRIADAKFQTFGCASAIASSVSFRQPLSSLRIAAIFSLHRPQPPPAFVKFVTSSTVVREFSVMTRRTSFSETL